MMAAGVNVALGTDGLGCLDRDDRVSVLDEMRFLSRRDGTDPRVLLAMGTTNGARGLGHDTERVTLGRGAQPAGLIALPVDPGSSLDPLEQVMRRDDAPEWLGEPRSDP